MSYSGMLLVLVSVCLSMRGLFPGGSHHLVRLVISTCLLLSGAWGTAPRHCAWPVIRPGVVCIWFFLWQRYGICGCFCSHIYIGEPCLPLSLVDVFVLRAGYKMVLPSFGSCSVTSFLSFCCISILPDFCRFVRVGGIYPGFSPSFCIGLLSMLFPHIFFGDLPCVLPFPGAPISSHLL